MLNKSNISKLVGWSARKCSTPSLSNVKVYIEMAKNGDTAAAAQLLIWHRFLPSNEKTLEITNLIFDELKNIME